MKKFPENFLWGTALSAYQTEGNNDHTDWWAWEKEGKTTDHSGRADDYWNLYGKDHDRAQELGSGSFRLSLSWARIEPEEGSFSEESILHYRAMLQDLKRRNIKTVVTLWWWVSPLWFAKKYGFHKKASVEIFTRYVGKVTQELGDLIDIFTVFNEPMVPLGQGYLAGVFPPGYKNPWKFYRALVHIAAAHRKSYEMIHARKKNAKVGISYLYNWYEKSSNNVLETIAERFAYWFRIRLLERKIHGYQDYFGINYYRLGRIHFDPKNSDYFGFTIDDDPHNPMGWVTYPIGIYNVIMEVHRKYMLPIYILENGVPTDEGYDDQKRSDFMRKHLFYVHKAINDGADVQGYFYWSLIDNYEWLGGFHYRFGLIEVDYKTLDRRQRQSFWAYKKIIAQNGVE